MRNPVLSSQIILSLLSFLLFSASATPPISLARDSSLSVEQEQDILTSPDNTFSSGFYKVGTNAYCFSIWFTNSSDQTVVWTANRDNPVNGRSSKISLLRDGNMVLTDVDGSTVWETNTSSTGVAVAELLNTGNLVLKDPDGGILWQSFDSLTDTLLPSQPLTKAKRLVSAMGRGTLGSGYYSLYFDNDNVLRLMYNGPEISSIYWPSPDYGVFQDGRTKYNSSRYAVLDDLGRFLSSDGLDVRGSDAGRGIRRRLTMDYDGNLRLYSLDESTGNWMTSWEAIAELCNVHGLCGRNGICGYPPEPRCSCPPGYEMSDPSDWNGGCKRRFNVSCGNQTQQMQFVKLEQTDFYGYDLGFNTSISFEACMRICSESCSCEAFGYRLTGTGVCYPKSALYNGYKSPNFPGSTYLKLPGNAETSAAASGSNQSELICAPVQANLIVGDSEMYGKSSGKQKWVYLYGFVSAIGVIEFLFISIGYWCLIGRYRTSKSVEEGYKMISNQFRRFTYRELREATGKFKEELGRGGSGAVYRGVLDDKRVLAVKKLIDVIQGEDEFWAEVSVIGRINHMNLVRMWGFCSEGQHRLLVYEYVENRSLDKFLFGRTSTGGSLGWNQRFKIAMGTAKGLAYLHHECLEWVIHCDVKPENILLDRDFEPKIADFGLAKLSRRDGSGFNFSRMRGTMGYMAPEWALSSPITAKVDVYSYGIVLIEMVKGSRISNWAVSDGKERDLRSFVRVVKEKLASGEESWVGDVVDSRLSGQFNCKQAMKMLEIAVSCVEEDSSRRPTMDKIVEALLSCEENNPHPAYS